MKTFFTAVFLSVTFLCSILFASEETIRIINKDDALRNISDSLGIYICESDDSSNSYEEIPLEKIILTKAIAENSSSD